MPAQPATPREASAPVGPPSTWLDAIELLALDDDVLLERVDRWYIPGRDPAVRPAQPPARGRERRHTRAIRSAIATLDRYATGDDPVLAEHARWAIDRLERRHGTGEDGPA